LKDFQPDFFSVNSDEPKSGGEVSNLQIIEVIHSQFPSIGEVKRTIELGGVGINSRNYKILAETGSYTFKLWGTNNPTRISEVSKISRFLDSKNVCVPVPVKSFAGVDYIKNDEKLASLLTFIEGQLYSPSQSDLPHYFNSISQLFENLREYKKSSEHHLRYEVNSTDLEKSISRGLNSELIWIENGLQDQHSSLTEIYPKILRDIRVYSMTNRSTHNQFSHFDLHPRNILKTSQDKFGFLDLEACGFMDPQIAWGFTLVKILRQVMAGSDVKTDPSELGKNALEMICSTSFGSRLDVFSLPVFGRIEILRRLSIIMDDYLDNESSIWLPMLPIQIQLLKESYLLFVD
jgi:hypothetical protein